MIRKNAEIALLNHEELIVKWGNTLGQLDTFSKRVNISSGSSIVKATLILEASQTYLSGAEVTMTLNRSNLKPILRWDALENKTKSQRYDVTSLLVLGVNEFSAIYKVAYGTVTDQKASISASILVELLVPKPESAGVTTGQTTSNDTLRNVGQIVREGLTLIVAAGVFISVAVLYFYTKAHPLKILKKRL